MEVAPRGRALLSEAGPAAAERLHHGQAAPGVCACPGQVTMILPAAELIQEPVNSLVVIAPYSSLSEPRVCDQRPDRSPGVELYSDAAKQIIDLGRVITAAAELDVPDVVSVHPHSQAFVLMSRTLTPTACFGLLRH